MLTDISTKFNSPICNLKKSENKVSNNEFTDFHAFIYCQANLIESFY